MKTPRRSNIVKCFSCDEWYQYDNGHKCKPAPVPEGVQGKEPSECGECCCGELCKYHQGEAAGRRSAITEVQEWATVDREKVISGMIDFYRLKAKCTELQEKTK